MSRYAAVELLEPRHDTSQFDCGSRSQTLWLRKYALQAQQSDTSRVYVACLRAEPRVVGYHALASGSVSPDVAPARIQQGTGAGHDVPVILLTRMGVDLDEQGNGLGRALVVDALRRVVAAADVIGARALLIHAENEGAREFYMHLAEFEESPTDPLHLLLLMKDLRAALKT